MEYGGLAYHCAIIMRPSSPTPPPSRRLAGGTGADDGAPEERDCDVHAIHLL